MARIAILTGIHLCHNPRVMKEAAALAEAGHDVVVLGGWIDPLLKREDRVLAEHAAFAFKAIFDMSESALGRTVARARNKLSAIARRHGRQSPVQLGYAYRALRRAAFKTDADLYVAHSEQGMAIAVDLARAEKRVGVDMEDWFSEDYPLDGRSGRPLALLRRLEGELLRRAAVTFCPSRAMSMALAQTYGCRPPTIVYNAFPRSDRRLRDGSVQDRRDTRLPSVHWFSQTVGPGRGLEDLIAALPMVNYDFELHLRGNPNRDFPAWLAERMSPHWQERLFIHPQVPNQQLLSRIAEHDIGFAGEMTYCRSRDLTVTNKLLHYLLGGLAVVASDTTGQREIAAQAGDAIFLYPAGDASALALRLNTLLGSPEMLRRVKTASSKAAEQLFCWEHEQPKLLEAVTHALKANQ